ncbi:MAG: hypothetical protein WDM91_10480 [Rhizomicrobium sp.]
MRRIRHVDRISIASPADFVIGPAGALDLAGASQKPWLPYCIDLPRRRAVYVAGADVAGAQDAPFYYLYLRRHAQRIAFVPWAAGGLRKTAGRAPIFLFSPGRCGSTLVSRMLSAAAVANVSEPDFYTQATSVMLSTRFNPWRERIRSVIAAMGGDLAAALDPAQSPVVKLRAESCRAPDLLVDPRERRTLFLTRGFEAWTRSNERAFRNGAHKSVGKYLRALRCYSWLKHNSMCHPMRYEDLQADPLAAAAALSGFLGRDISAAAVLSTMKEDSQDGTPLRQGARPDRPGWERRFDETMALWNSARVREVRDRLDVEDLHTG